MARREGHAERKVAGRYRRAAGSNQRSRWQDRGWGEGPGSRHGPTIAAPMFDFEISFEEGAARIAAHTFFMQVYGRLLFWMLLPYPVALACGIFLRMVTDISWVTWLLVSVALSPLYWVYLYWRRRRRLVRASTGTARVRLTDTEFSIATENGSHAWPWKTFKFARRDSANL